ncbi:MAG: type I DNA topoisomerase [Actinobacteria bacterium]|uniref:DNA topoisomerase n=1 Tax=freshwater metagenome TaxID=449393 RepID=A0A6J6JG20_9ZZZZ|nr:type I DNA topoisomerase [Actinomycetota bacterium]
MAKSLVIVESPAKAKTISKYLGPEFDVRASVGHVADLPSKGLAVDVENGFKPSYELTERGRTVVKELKALLKTADALYLATDEDREGEAISWHLLEHLKPKVPVYRMVFHEINEKSIQEAVANPRDLDYGLVDAAEARRILDRLYGYEVSPVLWRRVNRGLSAGRVQSPALRLVVERERERIAFRSADYFSLEALTSTSPAFTAKLISVNGTRLATGKDFSELGVASPEVLVMNGGRAAELVKGLDGKDLLVRSVDEKPYRSSPKAPFTTSTLQQEAGRKLRLSGRQVMSVAQGLYERGFITYMRTDSVTLSSEAINEIRSYVERQHGSNYLYPKGPRTFQNKVKNAQEAHEAIRPALPLRSPEQVSSELRGQELSVYRLIWQRTLASQMADTDGKTTSVRLGVTASDSERSDCEFSASGTTITFPGYRAAYEETRDEDDSESDDEKAALLPDLVKGQNVPVQKYTEISHTTTPPPRYTEASLVKMLEEKGIGRPSTWASIISQMVDRGHYLWKKGTSLVPTWTAFSVIRLLEDNFESLVDYEFTADLDNDLDSIARGELKKVDWLTEFYFGGEHELGLRNIVTANLDSIDAAVLNTFVLGVNPESGEDVIVKPGLYGPYVRCGEKNTASVPDTMTPDELTLDTAIALLKAPKGDTPIGEWEGFPVFAKSGRYGPYVQWGTMDVPPTGFEKPKMASLFKTMNIERITMKDALDLLSLPRTIGADPTDGELITAQNGKFGPYISKGKDSRSLPGEEELLTVTLEEALALLATPRVFGKGRAAAKPPLKEFGNDPMSGRPVIGKEGKFGDYITDGETNAGLTRGDRMEVMTNERAYELLQLRREYIEANGGPKKKSGSRKAAAKKAPAKKAAAKKVPAKKKAAGKKAPAKKKAAATQPISKDEPF